MFTRTIEEVIYSTEDKLPQPGEIVLVLRDDRIQDFHTQWFRESYQKLPLRSEWIAAEYEGDTSYGEARFFLTNLRGIWVRLPFYATHWKYIGTPPEELMGVEYSC